MVVFNRVITPTVACTLTLTVWSQAYNTITSLTSQGYELKALSPACELSEGGRTFSRWGLVIGSKVTVGVPLTELPRLKSFLSLSLCFLYAVKALLLCHVLPAKKDAATTHTKATGQAMGVCNHGPSTAFCLCNMKMLNFHNAQHGALWSSGREVKSE